MKYLIVTLLGLWLGGICHTQAQPSCQIERFSLYNGLSQRYVTNIVQDSKGFIWLATWNGLSKFDGYSFRNYKAYPGDGSTLTTNRFSHILPTSLNDIWCQSYDSRLYLFNSRTEQFTDVLLPYEKEHNCKLVVNHLYSLSKGVLWVDCGKHAIRIDEHAYATGSSDAITFFPSTDVPYPGGRLKRVKQDSNGNEWLFTTQGMSVLAPSTTFSHPLSVRDVCESGGTMYLLTEENRLAASSLHDSSLHYIPLPASCGELYNLQTLGDDTLAACSSRGILLYLPKSQRTVSIDLQKRLYPQARAERIRCDSHGQWWVFTDQPGVYRIDPASGRQYYYQTPAEDMPHTDDASRDTFFEDPQGTLWIVPHDGCLSWYDRQTDRLRPYYEDFNQPNTKFRPLIRCSLVDRQGNFWYANKMEMGRITFNPNACRIHPMDNGYETRAFHIDRNGLLWMANKRGHIRLVRPDGTLQGYLNADGRISPSEANFGYSIYSILEEADGTLWLGSRWDGLFCLTPTSGNRYHVTHYTHNPADPFSLSHNSIYSLCQDHEGRIWAATYGGGVNICETDEEGHVRFIHSGNRLKHYPAEHFSKVRVVKEVNGILLAGTTEGLLSFSSHVKNPEEIHFHINTRRPEESTSLCGNDIMNIFTDSRHTTYILSFTSGLNRIESTQLLSDTLRFRTYTSREGLPSDLLLSMSEDPQGGLWLISENALTQFDPIEGKFYDYDRRYLKTDIFFSEAEPVWWQGKLMAGILSGILEANTAELKKSSYTPPIVFTGLTIHGLMHPLPIDDLPQLTLKSDERNVGFHFAALDYADPSNIRYAYRMKGLEETWNEIDSNRSAIYINLPAGEYELQVVSTNSDGMWRDNLRTLPIRVQPTFRETPWAIVLLIFIFLLATMLVVYVILYIYRLHHQIDLEQRLVNLKLRFFTDISHELRTPLTLISSPVTEVLEHESLSPMARRHLNTVHRNTERMLRLVNQILDFRKIENKKMKLLLERTDVASLLQEVMDDFRLIAEERHIEFNRQMSQPEMYCWLDRDKVEKMLFNLLSNAFKFTPEGRSITVSAELQSDRLQLSVRDKGIGIDPKKQHSLFQRFETLVQGNILQPSSGIGLSLVRELVELHQGTIQVKSEPGEGSEFLLSLPAEQTAYQGMANSEFILEDVNSSLEKPETNPTDSHLPAADNSETEAETGPSQSDNPLCLLLVEDNKELREFLHDILSADYRIIEAANGREGLEQSAAHQPDFIISDVMMPEMDGLEMVRAIKQRQDICHIPIVLLSAKSSLDDRIQGLEQGIEDYITKPFSTTYLKTRIRWILQQRKELQRLYREQWAAAAASSLPAEPATQPHSEQEAASQQVVAQPRQPQITPFDEQFMQRVMNIMEQQMDNADFTIDAFAAESGMGRTVFYQKLKSLTGLAPVDFIRDMRIKRARQLIESGEYNVSTVAYMTGFNDPKYFSKCFKKQFGISPSDYGRERKQEEKQ